MAIFFSNPPSQLFWYPSQGESQNLRKCHIGYIQKIDT